MLNILSAASFFFFCCFFFFFFMFMPSTLVPKHDLLIYENFRPHSLIQNLLNARTVLSSLQSFHFWHSFMWHMLVFIYSLKEIYFQRLPPFIRFLFQVNATHTIFSYPKRGMARISVQGEKRLKQKQTNQPIPVIGCCCLERHPLASSVWSRLRSCSLFSWLSVLQAG